MSEYSFGDYVVYSCDYKDDEIGRVVRENGGIVFVCYHDGCTAAATPRGMLRKAAKEEIALASKNLGYHRFDLTCPDRIEECCYMCKAVLG